MPNITVVFNPPNKGDGRAQFEADCMDMGDKLNPFITQTNALAAGVNADMLAAASSATQANTAKNEAEAARDAAIAASTMVATSYNPAGVSYAVNDLVWDDPGTLYRCTSGYTSGATLPKDDGAHWVALLTSLAAFLALQATVDTLRNVPVVAVSGARTVADTDRGRNLQIDDTLTIPTGLTVGTTFVVTNLGSASVQIAPGSGLTLRLAGTSKTGAVTLAGYSKATVSIETGTLAMAAGAGLT